MLPVLPYVSSSQQSSFYSSSQSLQSISYSDVNTAFAGSQPFPQASQSSVSSGTDANSPEAFKQNIQLALGHVARVQSLARNALAGIENAYHPGTNPVQTAADVSAVQQAMQMLAELLRQTGVGALPIHPPDLANPPPEDEMISETTTSVQVLYERYKRMQDGAGVVTNLLSVVEAPGRR